MDIKSVNYLEIRQSVLTKILGLHTAFLHCAGFGKDKTDVSAVIPAVTRREFRRTQEMLLPEFTISPRQAKPNLGSIFKFIIDPFWPCLLLPLATWWLCPALSGLGQPYRLYRADGLPPRLLVDDPAHCGFFHLRHWF